MVETTMAELGRIDILVNNAGAAPGAGYILETNEIDTFYFCGSCIPQTKIAFQITFDYEGFGYLMFTPTLFELDMIWECYIGSPYDCDPEPHDYAP